MEAKMDPMELFWDLAADLLGRGGVEEGTMMGTACLRNNGEFFAMPDHREGGLIVKLPAARVDELVAEGVGRPFAPAGRAFREWVQVPAPDAARWRALLDEAARFVA